MRGEMFIHSKIEKVLLRLKGPWGRVSANRFETWLGDNIPGCLKTCAGNRTHVASNERHTLLSHKSIDGFVVPKRCSRWVANFPSPPGSDQSLEALLQQYHAAVRAIAAASIEAPNVNVNVP